MLVAIILFFFQSLLNYTFHFSFHFLKRYTSHFFFNAKFDMYVEEMKYVHSNIILKFEMFLFRRNDWHTNYGWLSSWCCLIVAGLSRDITTSAWMYPIQRNIKTANKWRNFHIILKYFMMFFICKDFGQCKVILLIAKRALC